MIAMTKKHPLCQVELTVKYIYCFGLGVMALGHMKAITETREYFDSVLEKIGLPPEMGQQIFLDINNAFDEKLQEVFERIKAKGLQYCFVLDLYQILGRTIWAQEYCSQVLEDYLQVFQFSAAERIFFQEFDKAMREKNGDAAKKACQYFSQEGYVIRYDFLTYFYPDFYMEDVYSDIRIVSGQTLIFDKPVAVHGNITIERGGSLLIHGGALQMEGGIQVLGGRIQLRHSQVRILACDREYWLELQNTAVVTIEDSVVDCGGHCGALLQNTGRLILQDSVIRNTARGRGVAFFGLSVKISECRFLECRNGGIQLGGAALAEIRECSFVDDAGEHGGGITSQSMEDVSVCNCRFVRCTAKHLGAAVYFRHQRLGQQVAECSFQDCIPSDSLCFNNYEEADYDH